MRYKQDWVNVKNRWQDYWKHKNTGCPLMYIIARKPEQEKIFIQTQRDGKEYHMLPPELRPRDPYDQYRNAVSMVERFRYYCESHLFLGDSFPNINVDFGPGSIAGYLGCEIIFNNDTVWFKHFIDNWHDYPVLSFDPNNKWWKEHCQLIMDIRKLAGEDFYIAIPDLIENIDILASLRGTQDTLFDMIDYPEELKNRISQVNNVYFEYYDRLYDMVKNEIDGGSCYTVFQIWGLGRTAKLQCDFSAMISPQNFRDYIQQPLSDQAKHLDNVLYHLDGRDAIKHIDAIMEIEGIDALQWTSGISGMDGTREEWDIIYDKVRTAGRSLWIRVHSGEYKDWIPRVDRIVKKYGSSGLFIRFPPMSLPEAENLLDYAGKNWNDIEGSFLKNRKIK
jgi:5-methyltetrahydrofolate--homocysteine methyltransferase